MQQTSIKDKKKVAKSWTDPLDDPNFDAGQYIDGFFPTEPTSESVSVELYKRITTVSEKVRDAEEAVKVITADIKTLDLGKKNLIQTMIVFRRLDMLGM
ncbi:hypothetical protein AX774_g6343 [Zancudomyces culisetae]|uniref:Vps53 N-terminal domain-containing protein n=1 Tax=Zancudomyces culisetae TaxID=1213189 RepID=A0A1R1PGU9_ZANCU|nr:hypothetical protein AX774_g6343 [Zancudomyces culisetae]|eukprot:OMH80225.1 hypothetical protein AX774_g6343 [Zancudomyces culisetae]